MDRTWRRAENAERIGVKRPDYRLLRKEGDPVKGADRIKSSTGMDHPGT